MDNEIFELIEYMGWEFPLPNLLILKPRPEEMDWGYYQLLLRVAAYVNQDGRCWCGHPLSSEAELHHALVTRRDVMGHSQPHVIHSSYNVILLHQDCHRKITRRESLKFLSTIFTRQQVLDWYYSLQLGLRRIEHV